jgi:hypothetical protein
VKSSGLTLNSLEAVMSECSKFKPFNGYAQRYYDTLPESYQMYGMKGVKAQVLYVMVNVKAKGPELQKLKKQLIAWAYE